MRVQASKRGSLGAMMSDSPQGSFILTLDDVLRLKGERDAAAVQLSEMERRVAAMDAKLEAIRLWLPEGIISQVFEESEPESDGEGNSRRKWAPLIFGMLKTAGHGLTTQDIKRRFQGTPLEDDIRSKPNALYNALSKMTQKRDLIRDGDYYCLPGQGKPSGAADHSRRSGAYEAGILGVLARFPSGLASGGIVSELRKTPVGEGMGRSTGYFYKVLARMLDDGVITKAGPLYSLPPKENEPPGGGSDTDHKGDHESPERSFPQPALTAFD